MENKIIHKNKVSKSVRNDIFLRDGFKCQVKSCGSTENLTIDHIRPLSEGGTNDFKNLQTMCYTCNMRKANYENFPLWGRIRRILALPEIFITFKNEVIALLHGDQAKQRTLSHVNDAESRIMEKLAGLKSQVFSEFSTIQRVLDIELTITPMLADALDKIEKMEIEMITLKEEMERLKKKKPLKKVTKKRVSKLLKKLK